MPIPITAPTYPGNYIPGGIPGVNTPQMGHTATRLMQGTYQIQRMPTAATYSFAGAQQHSYYGQQMYGASQMMAPGLPSAQMQQQPGMSSNPAYVQTLAWVPVGQGQSVMSTATGNIAAHEPMALSYQGASAYPTVPMPPPTSAQARGLTRDFDMELRAAQQQRDLLYRGDLLPEDSAYLLSDRPTRPQQRPINSLPQLKETISINPVTQSAR